MSVAQVDTSPITNALSATVEFIPKLIGFLLILVIGYVVARLVAGVLDKVLERVGFDRAVERGGVKQALARSRYDASGLLSKVVFYALMLFVLQLAFGVFPANPISDLITAVIAYLPKVFVAIVIVVVAAAIAAAVREIVDAALGGLGYGRVLANVASVAILAIGVFAALAQLEIAQPIVIGLFYALLAVVAGSAIVAIGGGGIMPMRRYWERALERVEAEAPAVKQEVASTSREDLRARAEQRKAELDAAARRSGRDTSPAAEAPPAAGAPPAAEAPPTAEAPPAGATAGDARTTALLAEQPREQPAERPPAPADDEDSERTTGTSSASERTVQLPEEPSTRRQR